MSDVGLPPLMWAYLQPAVLSSHGSSMSPSVATPIATPIATPTHSEHESEDFFSSGSSSVVFVFPDTIAFDHVRDKCHHAFDTLPVSQIKIVGFESYLIEQWMCSRQTKNQIVIYTGNLSDTVVAYRLEIVNNRSIWPSSFRHYIDELSRSKHSFPTQSEYGTIYVTNVAQLDASLSLVPVPSGNLKDVYSCYVVNHDLKRLGCGSRSATVISIPPKPVEDKFKSTFHIPHEVSLDYAVREFVIVLQTFLYYYGFLRPQFCDGLYCDKTELALSQWWRMVSDIKYCTSLLKRRPPNCTLAISVRSVIGFTLFIRTLLDLGSNSFITPKDVMDARGFRLSILLFQKSQKIYREKSHEAFLDHETLVKLFEWAKTVKTNQNFAKDLTKVKNMMKNTVMDFASAKMKETFAGISPSSKDASKKFIDCQDFEQFLLLNLGRQLQYLFLGKGRPIEINKISLAAEYRRLQKTLLGPSDNKVNHGRLQMTSSNDSNGPSASNECRGHYDELPTSRDRIGTYGTNVIYDHNGTGIIDHSHGQKGSGECPYSYRQLCREDAEGLIFEKRLKRRHSIPSIEKEANIYGTEMEVLRSASDINKGVLYSSSGKHACALKRSNSFSLVDESLESGGTDCFEWKGTIDSNMITSEWLATQYIYLLRQFKLGVLQKAADLKNEVASSKIQFMKEIRLDRVLAKYRNTQSEYTKTVSRYCDLNDKFKTSYKISARLKYELRLLLQKTKEVETNLKSLEDINIQSLEQTIKKAAADFHVKAEKSQNMVQPCDRYNQVSDPNDLEWKTIIAKPYLIFYIFVCYIRCLWLMYFENRAVLSSGDESRAFQKLFQQIYNGKGSGPKHD
ncbi:hypothetical protein FOA43_000883 [Brettanomyces nanus]|uniref:STB6-like N-terminal domain-containing protein n=1 Tax=Eeniella nana TaxID=13502 RepID=A0A875RWE9_EENNA|nr:uncharacterized protein FOA43_000883 [Brettanomyces nanus]QPG73571.1 hypothetical protein FOA43_000883 [Brettanomyces nanus]